MNNEDIFDITKVRFDGYLQGLKVGSKGFFAESLAELYHRVCDGEIGYGKLKKINRVGAPFVREEGMHKESTYLYFYLIKEPKHRPFTWEEREQLRDKWIRRKEAFDEEECIRDFHISNSDTFMINYKPASEILNSWEFLDGSPCGVAITKE